jgi:Rps23 Pro-64 3,4-dihydroxylase Tpa1-like proline 4-hydroxylase
MKLENVSKILEIYKSNDYSKIHTHYDLDWKKNIWYPIYKVSEVITLLEYNVGDFFGKHADGPSYESNNDIAILSGGYLLNEDFEGGEFIINDKKLDTPIGSIFTFGRNEMHEVNPVTKGTRYSLHFVVNKPKPKKTLL